MMTIGIICEYNPLHLGHEKQFRLIREHFGPDATIVCAMSGNFVQRGEPAIFDKSLRAKAAILAGADLVIELPVTVSLSSAEGFAAGGVAALSPVCDYLCFGAESETENSLMETARVLLSDDFPPVLKKHLNCGVSFPKARALALEALGLNTDGLNLPNNTLGLEYCKAIIRQSSALKPFVIRRGGSYHDEKIDGENPSATALRKAIGCAEDFLSYVPECARSIFESAQTHTLAAGERAVLYRLRTMQDAEFEGLPFGSEGLWRKLMHEAREKASLPEIMEAVKSKRYTYTRIARMVMCACLGISGEMMHAPIPYYRVLGFTDAGRRLLAAQRKSRLYRNTGEKTGSAYEAEEKRWNDLYGLFAEEFPTPAGNEANRRAFYLQSPPSALGQS